GTPSGGPLSPAGGRAAAGDLAGLLTAEGFELRRRVLYESATATALSPETLAALERGRVDLVLLFSPRTAATFAGLAKEAGIDAAALTALCLSPGGAAAGKGLSWRRVEVAEKPELPALLALVDRVKEKAEAESRSAPLGAPQPMLAAREEPALVPATPVPTMVPAPHRSGASVFLAG